MRLREVWTIVRQAASYWMADNATRLSAALAFYTILSLAPLLVITTAIVGWAFQDQDMATTQLQDQMRGLAGDAGADVAKAAVENAKKPGSGILATVIGVATLLFGASGVFTELQGALNTVWGVKPKPGRGILATIKDRFLSFGMVLVVGFLLLVSLVLTTTLTAVVTYVGGHAAAAAVLHVFNAVVSFLVVALLFALIFKYLPDAKIAWRDVWFGALVTSALFTIGKYLIGLYLAQAAPGSAFGAAGSVVAFVVWVYYSGLIVFFGAELTRVTAEHAGRRIRPAEGAVPANAPTAESKKSRKRVSAAK
jgi:membrane protein